LTYQSSWSLGRGRVVGPDLTSVLVLVGIGRRAVGIVDEWWCGRASSIGGGMAVDIVGGWLGSTLRPWALDPPLGSNLRPWALACAVCVNIDSPGVHRINQ
jgi:hypothetical protein